MDHFPDLTDCVAVQTVGLAHGGMCKRLCGGAGQLGPSGSPHLHKSKSIIELHVKLRLSLP